jgi:hypothetical protein
MFKFHLFCWLAGHHDVALSLLAELKERLSGDAAGLLRVLEMRIQVLTLAGQVGGSFSDHPGLRKAC